MAKKFISLLCVCCLLQPNDTWADKSSGSASLKPIIGRARFGKSRRVDSLKASAQRQRSQASSSKKRLFFKKLLKRKPSSSNFKPQADPVVQKSLSPQGLPSPLAPSSMPDGSGTSPSPQILTPQLSFDGLKFTDNLVSDIIQEIGYVFPPDTNGAVGLNHYVQTINTAMQVYDKSIGNPLLPGPVPLASIWDSIGGACAENSGDAIVRYDRLADRWLISQFFFPAFNDKLQDSHQCIAVSETGDPTGVYFLYDFTMPNGKFNDYPKFGVWPDAYYMTDNQFNPTISILNSYLGVGVFAFDRAKMLAGDPSASYIYFDLESLDPSLLGMLPADLDGPTPPSGSPAIFASLAYDTSLNPTNALRLFRFHADFANGQSWFGELPESPLSVASFNPVFCCIPQPPGGDLLDSITDRLMYRLQYRNFGDHESLVVNHTVNVSGTASIQAGVRWYELRRSLPGGSFLVYQQGTYAPDSENRWMGSVAMDGLGNLAIGYSVASADTYPSIRYAGRLASDPPGILTLGEGTLASGGEVQNLGLSRWGDYSSMSIDPSNDSTFWYTQEYYASGDVTSAVTLYNGSPANFWRTRIGKFRFSVDTLPVVAITAPANGTAISGIATISGTAADNRGIAKVEVQVDNGVYLPATGTTAWNYSLNTSSLADGSHILTVRATDTVGNAASAAIRIMINTTNLNNAKFVSQDVPLHMTPGNTYSAGITVQNTGTTVWTAAANYSLGSQNPQDNTTWGLGRVHLSPTDSVAPGQVHTFIFNVTAPAAPNVYNFQWQMVQDGVQHFGDYTPNLAIEDFNNDAFTAQSGGVMGIDDVPLTMLAGQQYGLSVLYNNTGKTTWTAAANYSLGFVNPPNNTTWGLNRVHLSPTDSIAPGGFKWFYTVVTAPSMPGNYNLQLRMVQDGVQWFGYPTPNIVVTVVANAAQFISQSVPTTLNTGQSATVSITLKNIGSSTWTPGSGYKLGSQNPQDNTTWGLSRVNLDPGDSIAPGQSKTFSFNILAPSPGTYNFQWRMVQGVQWFGDYTPNVAVTTTMPPLLPAVVLVK